MMKAALTALALGASVFLVSPQSASAAPMGLQGATTQNESTVEKAHGRRHGHHHHYRHRHWNHGHHYYYRPHHYHHRRHYQVGPHFGFSFGPAWGYGHRDYHHRRWHW